MESTSFRNLLFNQRLVADQIVAAVEQVYSPSSSREMRQQAQSDVKAQPNTAASPDLLARLFQHSSDTVRFFSLTLLEHAVRFHWSLDHAAPIQAFITQIIEVILQRGNQEPKYVAEKVIRVACEVAERSWPQNWPQLHSILLTLFSHSDYGKWLTLLFLRYLAEDTFTYATPLTTTRKEDLRNAMLGMLSPTVESVSAVQTMCGMQPGFEGWMAIIVQHLSAWASSPSDQQEKLLVAGIHALSAYIDWVTLDLLIQNRVVYGVVSLLMSPFPSVRMAASEAFLMLAARKHSDMASVAQFLYQPILEEGGIEAIFQVWTATGGELTGVSSEADEHLDSNYPLLKRIAQIWSLFGCEHILAKRAEKLPPNFNLFLQFMMVLTKSSSMVIVSQALDFWTKLLRHDSFSKDKHVEAILEHLFGVVVAKMDKSSFLPSDDDKNPMGMRYSAVDFPDSFADFQTAFGSFRSQCYFCVRFIVDKRPFFAVSTCADRIKELISTTAPSLNDTKYRNPQSKTLTVKSPYYILWETNMSLLNAALQGLAEFHLKRLQSNAESQAIHPQIVAMSQNILSSLLGVMVDEPLVLVRLLDGLVSFVDLLAGDLQSFALTVLQKVFQYVTFTLPNEPKIVGPEWIVSEDTLSLRRKACASLIRLASGIPDVLMSIYNDVQNAIKGLHDSQMLSFQEKAQLSEFMVSAIHASKSLNAAQRTQLYMTYFEPQIQEISDPEFLDKISSPVKFINACGLNVIADISRSQPNKKLNDVTNWTPELNQALFKAREFRSYTVFLINAYRGCLSKSVRITGGIASLDSSSRVALIQQSPWAVHLSQVLTHFTALIRNIHALWESVYWSDTDATKLPTSLKCVLEMSHVERNVILGQTSAEASEEDHQKHNFVPKSIDDHAAHIRNWLRSSRELVYALLGQMTYLTPTTFFYATPNLAQSILKDIFGSVTSISNSDWRLLVHFFVRPLIVQCPKEFFQSVLAPILPPMLSYLGNKLNVEWKEAARRGIVQVSSEDVCEPAEGMLPTVESSEQATDEIIYQKVLRDLTREWSDIWGTIFLHQVPSEKKQKQVVISGEELPKAQRKLPNFGPKQDMVEFFLTNQPITEPLLMSLMFSLTWKDSRTCLKSCRILSQCVLVLSPRPEFQPFLGGDLLLTALKSLHDGYHQEEQEYITNLITEIYSAIRPQTDLPLKTLASVINEFQDHDYARSFDSKFLSESPTNQKKIMREALKNVKGLKPSEWFRKLDHQSSAALLQNIPEKMLLGKRVVENDESDQVHTGFNLGLLELFNENSALNFS